MLLTNFILFKSEGIQIIHEAFVLPTPALIFTSHLAATSLIDGCVVKYICGCVVKHAEGLMTKIY